MFINNYGRIKMIEKYGKAVEMRRINRNMSGIKKAIEVEKSNSDKY